MGLFSRKPKYHIANGSKTTDIEIAIKSYIDLYDFDISKLEDLSESYHVPPQIIHDAKGVYDTLTQPDGEGADRQAVLNHVVSMLAALLRNAIAVESIPKSEKGMFEAQLIYLRTYFDRELTESSQSQSENSKKSSLWDVL